MCTLANQHNAAFYQSLSSIHTGEWLFLFGLNIWWEAYFSWKEYISVNETDQSNLAFDWT